LNPLLILPVKEVLKNHNTWNIKSQQLSCQYSSSKSQEIHQVTTYCCVVPFFLSTTKVWLMEFYVWCLTVTQHAPNIDAINDGQSGSLRVTQHAPNIDAIMR